MIVYSSIGCIYMYLMLKWPEVDALIFKTPSNVDFNIFTAPTPDSSIIYINIHMHILIKKILKMKDNQE